MTGLAWTNDRTQRLQKSWEAGLTASQIAAELGGVTRSAVIGKVHRLGLSGRGRVRRVRPAALGIGREPPRARPRRPSPPGRSAVEELPKPDRPADTRAFDNAVPDGQRLTLMQLSTATCHWPIGDPDSSAFFFCGGRALQSSPYCAHHSRVAYRPVGHRVSLGDARR